MRATAAVGRKRPATASVPSAASQDQGLLAPYLSSNGDWAVVPPSTKEEILHGSMVTIDHLFGSKAGTGFLIEQCLMWFSDDGKEGVHFDWYIMPDATTKRGDRPSIEPSPFNRDIQEQTCEEYKHRLLQEGQPQSVAGLEQIKQPKKERDRDK